MKLIISRAAPTIAVWVLVAILGAGCLASAQTPSYPQPSSGQDPKDKAAQPSEAERQAATKISSATDFNAALLAAGEFVKKYPKSTLRPQITRGIVTKASGIQDTAQQITMLESALTVLKEPSDAEILTPVLLDVYVRAEKYDDVFRVGGAVIEKKPDDLAVLTQLALVGFEQVKRNNPKFVQQSMQYAPKAIALIEADKRPAGLEDAQWSEYKTRWLALLYQSMGIVAMMSRNPAEARVKLDKAASINPSDPITYMIIGGLVQDEYAAVAQQVKAMLPGKAQDDLLKQALEKMDRVIELYAQAIALAGDDLQYMKLRDELMADLKSYYNYRHNSSPEGLQQLIDKYKKPK